MIDKSKYPKTYFAFETWYYDRMDDGDYLLNLEDDKEGVGFYSSAEDMQFGVFNAFFDDYKVYMRVKWYRRTVSGLKWTFCTRNGAYAVTKQDKRTFKRRGEAYRAGFEAASEMLEYILNK